MKLKIIYALEDDDNDDDENEDDADYEEVVVSRNLLSFMEEDSFEARPTKRRSWDDEYVLKRQFSALIPAFDPRPGRTNVNQTTGKENSILLLTIIYSLINTKLSCVSF